MPILFCGIHTKPIITLLKKGIKSSFKKSNWQWNVIIKCKKFASVMIYNIILKNIPLSRSFSKNYREGKHKYFVPRNGGK